ncbi:MAG: ADP-ribosylglycohydrolase family protein [Elusimicrobia bacterium]|nr:ADP-ribosylglycohydrolase family protein [Elusimicrobiota bacterium]
MTGHESRLAGALLGTALGDALGLPAERLPAETVARRFGRMDRFHLLGRMGFVSDDTEQAALVAQSLALHPADPGACAGAFRRSLLGWFLRLPWGVGWATVRACLRIALGLRESGVASAGNGAAMRAAVVGAFFLDDAPKRRAFGESLARVTHTDARAVEAALFAAEVAALCVEGGPGDDRTAMVRTASRVITNAELAEAVTRATELSATTTAAAKAAEIIGNTGYCVHTAAFAAYCFVRYGGDPLEALARTAGAGGDSDSIGAIVGAWVGALHGDAGLPQDLIGRINDGPFGPTHLRALAKCLADLQAGGTAEPPGYSALLALARNLALYPVILGHGFRRLLPF